MSDQCRWVFGACGEWFFFSLALTPFSSTVGTQSIIILDNAVSSYQIPAAGGWKQNFMILKASNSI